MERQRDNRTEEALKAEKEGTLVIPVIQEQVTFDKEVVETGKVIISKKVVEEEATLNIPLIQEGYSVQRVPVSNQVYDTPPSIRHEGEDMIIPVVREVAVIVKRYEVVEELHVIKTRTEVPQIQQVTLLKEEVQVERRRTDTNNNE